MPDCRNVPQNWGGKIPLIDNSVMISDFQAIIKKLFGKNLAGSSSSAKKPDNQPCQKNETGLNSENKDEFNVIKVRPPAEKPSSFVHPPNIHPVKKDMAIPDGQKAASFKRPKNKHGMPKIKTEEDLLTIFEAEVREEDFEVNINPCIGSPENKRIKQVRGHEIGGKVVRKQLVNKNGLPILGNQHDLTDIFLKDSGKGFMVAATSHERSPAMDSEEKFDAMLENSLSGMGRKKMLQEKDSAYPYQKPLSITQKMERYPGPQEELDLHGFTSIKAKEMTTHFLTSQQQKGTLTVRIIVGRGLHSEAGAILPDVVEDVIWALKQKEIVLGYRWEKKKKSKSGALIVYLA